MRYVFFRRSHFNDNLSAVAEGANEIIISSLNKACWGSVLN